MKNRLKQKRRILCTVLAVISVFNSPLSPVFAAEEKTIYIGKISTSTSPLNVRDDNSMSGDIIDCLEKNSYVYITDKKSGWHRVEYEKGSFGWCKSEYIKQIPAETAYIRTSGSPVNVRNGAGLSNDVTDTVECGEKVAVIHKYRKWSKIVYSGSKSGFVKNTYLSPDCPRKFSEIILDAGTYKQTDPRWADIQLGCSEKTIATSGCTTSCLAMSESYIKNEAVYPNEMEENLSYSDGGSLYWPEDYITETDTDTWAETVYETLKSGRPVIIGAEQESGRQHWVLIRGYCGSTDTLENDGFLINDPATASRQRLSELFDEYPYFLKIAYSKEAPDN